jgi:hypothetical protein
MILGYGYSGGAQGLTDCSRRPYRSRAARRRIPPACQRNGGGLLIRRYGQGDARPNRGASTQRIVIRGRGFESLSWRHVLFLHRLPPLPKRESASKLLV